MKHLLFLALVLVSATGFASNEVSPAARAAHDAYLRKDGAALIANIKEALTQTNNHPAIVSYTMSLFAKAKKQGILNAVETGWKKPKEVSWLGFEVQRRYRSDNGKVGYNVSIAIDVLNGSELEQIQVARYPNEVVLDLQGKIGDVYPDQREDYKSTWIGSATSPRVVPQGLYLVNIKLKGQQMVQGWFLLDDLNSSASPVMTSPQPDEVVTTSQPKFSWVRFKSPEFKEGEFVRTNVRINNDDEKADEQFNAKLNPNGPTTFTVGDKAAAEEYNGVSRIAPGRYRANIAYREVSKFGDIDLRRGSRTIVPFVVK